MPDEKRPKRVALYARVSTADQTPENQLLDMRRLCASRGWSEVGPFIDVGISGAKADRPHLAKLMGVVREGRVDGVLVWRFDRFARSLSHLVDALQEFNRRGIFFASYSEHIDTGTAQGKMVFAIMAAMAEFERDLITERIHSGIRRASICRTCHHDRHKDAVCASCPCTTYVPRKHLGRPNIPENKIAEVASLRGTLSLRQIAARVGLSKSTVAKIIRLSENPMPNVASCVDGDSVRN